MKVALINGSPKKTGSASATLLGSIKGRFPDGTDILEVGLHTPSVPQDTVAQLHCADAWIFAYPLYVDGLPGHLLSCLITLEEARAANPNTHIYGIVNCGFYEGIQAESAIRVLQNWCEKAGASWGGGVGIGGGGAVAQISGIPRGHGPAAPIDRALDDLAVMVLQQQTAENRYVNIGFPRILYKLCAQAGWRQTIKANGGRSRDLGNRPED